MAKEFYLELARKAGLDEKSLEAITQAIGVDGFVKALDDHLVKQQSDYSRNMDELRRKELGYQQWYTDALKTFEDNKIVVTQLTSQVNAYREAYGELTSESANANRTNGNQTTIASPVTGDWVSRKELTDHIAKLGEQAVELVSVMTDCGIDYYSRFNERLPSADLKKFALEKNLPLSAAYDAFIRPKLEEKVNKTTEERIKQAREEGARDALAKHNIPVDTKPADPHFLFDRPAAKPGEGPQTEHERVGAFTDFFNSPEMQEAARK